jgi:hypothetical protein
VHICSRHINQDEWKWKENIANVESEVYMKLRLQNPTGAISTPVRITANKSRRNECNNMNSTYFVTFEVFAAMTTKNSVFWDVTPCGSCKNGLFIGMYHLHHQDKRNQRTRKTLLVTSNWNIFLQSVLQFLVTANDFPSSLILFSPMMEAILSSETLVLTRATWRHIPEDCILHSHRRETSILT